MSSPDPIFAPRVPDDEVTRRCRAVLYGGDDEPRVIADDTAHAIVARRVTAVADLDATDGPIGAFIRTGSVPVLPGPHLWQKLYGAAFGTLPEDLKDQAGALAVYLGEHGGRGPVAGWPGQRLTCRPDGRLQK